LDDGEARRLRERLKDLYVFHAADYIDQLGY
jgi:hypothetical protein